MDGRWVFILNLVQWWLHLDYQIQMNLDHVGTRMTKIVFNHYKNFTKKKLPERYVANAWLFPGIVQAVMFVEIVTLNFEVDHKQLQLLLDDRHRYQHHLSKRKKKRVQTIIKKSKIIVSYLVINNLRLVVFVRERNDAFHPDYWYQSYVNNPISHFDKKKSFPYFTTYITASWTLFLFLSFLKLKDSFLTNKQK